MRAETTAFLRSRSGTSALEFAILSPVFILILLGILVYGIYLAAAHGVQQIASEAARAAVAGLDPAERASLATARALAVVETYPLLALEHMSIDAAPDGADADLFRVIVRYDASHLGLTAFSGLLPLPESEIRRASIVRRGGY